VSAAKVSERVIAESGTTPDEKERSMPWMINCECGEVSRGETDDELIAAVEQHVREKHPDMVGRLSREQILGMAEVA
jgi:hypothetical protein